MDIARTVRERFGVDLQEFGGARVSAEIPISEELVNRTLAERLANHPHIVSIVVRAQEGDVIAAQVVARSRLVPPVRILARIERQPVLPQDPTLLLRWSMPAAGPLAMFAAPALAFFKAMPLGIRMDGDRLAIDLRVLLRARDLDDVLRYVRSLEVHTRPGGFVARVEVAV